MTNDQEGLIVFVFLVLLLIGGKWMFGAQRCFICGGSGIASNGYEACGACEGKGHR